MMPLNTPVAFFIFNRPDTTSRVFAEIAQARPRKLLVVADGPRSVEEEARCRQAREVIKQVNWDCEVLTQFSDINLGCRRRVSSGLDWVFGRCEEAIILEDDCLPHPSFFPYCEEMLARYRDETRVLMVNGNNFGIASSDPVSYYFSQFPHIWGWASWRRAWQHYDVSLAEWPRLRKTPWLGETLDSEEAAQKWGREFDLIRAGHDTWDFQWAFALWKNDGLCVAPNGNLISNIGFSPDATHTRDAGSADANLPIPGLTLPLRHPPAVALDREADARGLARILGAEAVPARLTLPQRLRRKVAFLRQRLGGRLEGPLRLATSPRLTRALIGPALQARRSARVSGGRLSEAEFILVIRLDEIGDLVLSTPFLRELRRSAPQARITLVVKPAVSNLMELCPYVDEALEFDGKIFGRLWPLRRHLSALRFARTHLWTRRFEVALLPRWDYDQSHATFLAYFSGAPARIGYSEEVVGRKRDTNRGYDSLLTRAVPTASGHELERNLDLLRAAGGESCDQRLEIWLSEDDSAFADGVFRDRGIHAGDSVVALGVGASEGKKMWPIERFIHLGASLLRQPRCFLLIVGAEADAELGQQVAARLGARVLNVTGQTTLRQAGALLHRCCLFIGNDSGPAHLAAAAGLPVVQVNCHPVSEDPADDYPPMRFSPRSAGSVVLQPDEALSPCRGTCEARLAHCITGVSVSAVLAAADAALGRSRHSADVCEAL